MSWSEGRGVFSSAAEVFSWVVLLSRQRGVAYATELAVNPLTLSLVVSGELAGAAPITRSTRPKSQDEP